MDFRRSGGGDAIFSGRPHRAACGATGPRRLAAHADVPTAAIAPRAAPTGVRALVGAAVTPRCLSWSRRWHWAAEGQNLTAKTQRRRGTQRKAKALRELPARRNYRLGGNAIVVPWCPLVPLVPWWFAFRDGECRTAPIAPRAALLHGRAVRLPMPTFQRLPSRCVRRYRGRAVRFLVGAAVTPRWVSGRSYRAACGAPTTGAGDRTLVAAMPFGTAIAPHAAPAGRERNPSSSPERGATRGAERLPDGGPAPGRPICGVPRRRRGAAGDKGRPEAG